MTTGLSSVSRDIRVLFAARIVRLFAYGFVSVVLALYLAARGLSDWGIGLLLSATLLGDAAITLWLTTIADRFGRRRILLLGATLMVLAGTVFVLTDEPLLLALAAIIGVISPSGYEIGPFLSVEQAALTGLVPGRNRTRLFAWYHLAGSLATAAGSLAGGWLAFGLQKTGMTALGAYQSVLTTYAVLGGVLVLLFLRLSAQVEVQVAADLPQRRFGLHRSRGVVMRLSALFAVDAFAGGFVIQSLLAYWFYLRFGISEAVLGSVFFVANLLAGMSALLASRLAARFGLINTMVFTHLPSNILLCLVPFMPTLSWALAVLLVRFTISQMDVPTRQSYTMAVVDPDERSAASGITTIARSLGAALSPALSGALLATSLHAPFLLAGGLKIIYDLALWRSFRALKPGEE
ncbi:MAG: MFS transporter [Gammaproteobacteria bacterium]|nr:MFS transporter [Gammaproteobacteria bacterium]MCP5140202.1 MFS transporter [Chromatiales bacterium]